MPGITYKFLGDARVTVVVGHFGSGKTEFSVNLALRLREQYAPVALADLDVVDPYFRSRECAALLRTEFPAGGNLLHGAHHHQTDLVYGGRLLL